MDDVSSPAFLSDGGEMGGLIRSHDWPAVGLGPPSEWPQPLKTLVSVMLASAQPMFIAWGEARTMLYNDAYVALLGRKHPAALGQPMLEVWSESRAVLTPLVEQVFGGRPVHLEDITLFPDRDGAPEEAHFAFSYTPVHDEAGVIRGLFCPCRETTRQVHAERDLAAAKEEAVEANRAKSLFIANMSHELRTPLSAIIGYSEMMIEELSEGGDPQSLADDIRKIEGNARHLLGLINDVLDLSKIESGKMEVFAETLDVEATLRDVAATVASLFEKRDNRLELALGPGLGFMWSDVTKTRQIMLNLLSNATKFTDAGTITLSAERTQRDGGDWLVFRVADTGIGMTEDQQTALFQRFQQADASTTRKFGGTGLGLSITRAYCEMLGGDVSVESEANVGSIFTIALPARLPTQHGAPDDRGDSAPHIAPAAPDTRDVVLVIDDDASQRDLMSRFLEREGFRPVVASDGREGLELAQRLVPKAILLDVLMPGMDGWSVLSALKADPELVKIPVVMVTFMHERGLANALGASDFVSKPVQWDRFRQVMDRFRQADGDVLVIDDDSDARRQMRRVLERDGWTVAEAANGEEALASVGQAKPRVILLDLTMPVMDGFAFLHELRRRPGCDDIPVVVLTARDLTRDDRKRLRGASQVLNKGETSLRDLARDLRTLAEAN